MNVALLVVGIAGVALGVLAYRGVWQNWMRPVRRGHYGYSVGFGFLYFGIAGFLLAPGDLLRDAGLTWLATILGLVAIISTLIFAMALFWLPPVLLPAWFKTRKRSWQSF